MGAVQEHTVEQHRKTAGDRRQAPAAQAHLQKLVVGRKSPSLQSSKTQGSDTKTGCSNAALITKPKVFHDVSWQATSSTHSHQIAMAKTAE